MTNVQMEFPETWEEYEQEYGFNDTDEVYTNNSRLIPSFRVKQWLDHLEQEPKTGHWLNANRMFINNDNQIIHEMHCSNCKGIAYFRASYGTLVGAKICPNCGADMRQKESEKNENSN